MHDGGGSGRAVAPLAAESWNRGRAGGFASFLDFLLSCVRATRGPDLKAPCPLRVKANAPYSERRRQRRPLSESERPLASAAVRALATR